ncbi:alpha/beta hydrolase [Lactococcus paracarnosus]|uniref:Acetylesterase n=1 Tax=Pseudolactococcus paracarnosus TaxID=2749962 RepID=A0ABT0ANJ1_9LACT|nr:alpha/beta hydrolase-fold protein [Lactococcus paracarnosus]MCJ1978134.1 hypothetical protein [Lactococcus paracarnosus]MCJ1984291.1 hypothetical protein [Lactococcus paracarnosus]MCJ1998583.1 hypothetical protein [Lactococcus paracarnosus]
MAYLELQYASQAISKYTTLKAYLPSDGTSGTLFVPPYKTVYFLPGFSNDATALMTYLGLRKECELKGIAIVVVDGDNSFYVEQANHQANYSTFIREVVEVTRKLLPLSENRNDTFIGGISMGGYGALLNGLRFRDMFSKIVALSPSADCYDLICHHNMLFQEALFTTIFGDKATYYAEDTNLAKFYGEVDQVDIPELFIACGEQDDLVLNGVTDLRDSLIKEGIPFVDRRGTGKHEYAYWEKQMDPAFSFLADIQPGTQADLILKF